MLWYMAVMWPGGPLVVQWSLGPYATAEAAWATADLLNQRWHYEGRYFPVKASEARFFPPFTVPQEVARRDRWRPEWINPPATPSPAE